MRIENIDLAIPVINAYDCASQYIGGVPDSTGVDLRDMLQVECHLLIGNHYNCRQRRLRTGSLNSAATDTRHAVLNAGLSVRDQNLPSVEL